MVNVSLDGLKPFIYSIAYIPFGYGEPHKSLNVGILVYSLDTGDLAAKQARDHSEILNVADELTLEIVSDFFNNLEQSIQPYLLIPGTRMESYPDLLVALATERTGSLRFSMPLDVISVSIDEALHELSRQYLEDTDD